MNKKMKIITASLLLTITGYAVAVEKPLVDAGELYVYGDLVENTCRLSMDSAWQDVELGTTTRADVNVTGKAGRVVPVVLYLRDCPVLGSWSTNITPMTTTASTMQPPYKARFVAKADEANPDLIKVIGAKGIALRLKNSRGQTVKFSRLSDVSLLNPGQDQVAFTLQPERTSAPFEAGSYHAVINFSMIYQ